MTKILLLAFMAMDTMDLATDSMDIILDTMADMGMAMVMAMGTGIHTTEDIMDITMADFHSTEVTIINLK